MSEEEGFLSHLVELRNRLLKCVLVFMAVFLVLMFKPGAAWFYDLLARPMLATLPPGTRMIATGVITPFMVPVKVTMLMTFLVVLPVLLYQAWAFVAPGLYTHEKRLALPVIVSSTFLFLLGIAFCYFFVFNTVFKFIAQIAPSSITPAPDIEAYLSFVMTMFLAFGVTFEVPIVVVILVRFGIVTIKQLQEIRGYFIVGAFVVAAVVTPPDVLSQILLAGPLCLLFELGVFIARFVVPRARASHASLE